MSDEPEEQWDCLKYLLSQGTKENLVASPLDWEGLHCARPLVEGTHLTGHWFNRTEEWKARRRGEKFEKYDYATEYRVEFAQLPAARHLTPEEYQKKVADLIEEIEEEAREERGKKTVVGMSVIQAQNPHYRPKKAKSSPAPRFHAADDDVYLGLVAEYSEFLVNYHAAAEQLKSSSLESVLGFPSGCYPPALPFVGALHESRSPPPPPTRVLEYDEEGEIIYRGEIPVVVVPGRSPPSRDPPS